MTDFVTVDNGALTDYDVAVDVDGDGKPHQKVKVEFGADGTFTPVSAANPLPVTQTGIATAANQSTIIGHVDGIEALLTTIDADTGVMAGTTQVQDDAYVAGPAQVIAGVRRDADTSPVSATGDVHPLVFDSVGRLKVSEPAVIITGAAAQTATVNNIIPDPSGASGTDVTGFRSASVQIVSTGSAGTFIFEQSNDGTNWVALPVFNAALVTGVPITAAITATASQIVYTFPIRCAQIRVRIATTITGGSIRAFTRLSTDAWTPTVNTIAQPTAANLNATVSGTVTASGTVGPAAHDAAISGNPVRLAGRALSANYATVATGDTADLVTSLVGALVITPYSIPALYWQTTTTLTGTADVALQALLAGNRRYLTSWTLQNTAAATTTVNIKDGTTTIWTCNLPASMAQPQLFQLVNPLFTTAGAALNIAQTNGTTPNVIVNAQGFTAP